MNIKQFLLASTVLTVVSGPAFAEGPAVSLGGHLNFQAGYSSQEDAFETGTFARDLKFANDTEVHVNVEGKTDAGLTYGAVVELESDVTADARGEGLNADKTYLFFEGAFGRVELGNQEDAATAMTTNASTIARATGGIEGDSELYYNFNAIGAGQFLFLPNLPTVFTGGVTEDATKIIYYTPKWNGLQFGVDFAPDSGNGGTAAGFTTDADAGDFENMIQAGLSYENEFQGGVGLQASIVGEIGESESNAQEDLQAYQAGLKLSYQGFAIAGSYGDWDDSGLVAGTNQDVSFWTAGVAYETGPIGVSLTHMDSDFADNEFRNTVLGADYQLAPGLVPYAEISFFEFDEAGTSVDNEGTLFLVGTALNF